MIEEVDPADTAKLDEIDARVKRWIGWDCGGGEWSQGFFNEKYKSGWRPEYKYTRSRDALKVIRPDGWLFVIQSSGFVQAIGKDIIYHEPEVNLKEYNTLQSPSNNLPTEELAELHAIIQAIAYERGE